MSRFPGVDVFQSIPCALGEGVCWHPTRKTVWWIDILGPKAYESAVDGGAVRTWSLPQMVGAVAPAGSGGLVAALRDGVYGLDPDTGKTSPFAAPPEHDAGVFRFNDAKVDPAGRFWAGTLALDGRKHESRLYRIDADGRTTVMRTGVSISNGLAWSLDGTEMYYIDSWARCVQAFPFDLEKGTLGEPRVAVSFDPADGLPDGCTRDAEGHLWVAHWGGGRVSRWEVSTGRRLQEIHLPVRNVTSCAFVGERLDTLAITTARDEPGTAAEAEAGFVFLAHPGTVGTVPTCFAGA
ncbi:MAG: SMP-30/gluconolactonase/LRE family protein [Opitutaceae bacterium]